MRAPQEVLPETYKKYFVNPVDFNTLAERIRQRAFHSADEFLGEVKWMQHNALILDSGGEYPKGNLSSSLFLTDYPFIP